MRENNSHTSSHICMYLHSAPSRRGSYPTSRTQGKLGSFTSVALLLCTSWNEWSRNHSDGKKPPTLHKLQLTPLFLDQDPGCFLTLHQWKSYRLRKAALPQHICEKLLKASPPFKALKELWEPSTTLTSKQHMLDISSYLHPEMWPFPLTLWNSTPK